MHIAHIEISAWWLLAALAFGWWAYRARRAANYRAAYRDGHRQGVLDAVPWECGCGCCNPGNRLMCGVCGQDRYGTTDELPKEPSR